MKISVVIVAYNSCDYIGRCLDSVFSQSCDDKEIIVVDNGSCDRTAELMRGSYPAVELIQNIHNKGASFARNQGIGIAGGEWILTLDSDVVLEKDFLFSFLKFLDNLKREPPSRVGIIVPKILCPDTQTIFAVGSCLTPLRRFYNVGSGKKDKGQFDRKKDIFGACSASAFYRREMLDELKTDAGFYFDEDLFFMGEDMDLSWRAQRRGWKVYVCKDCRSIHTGNGAGTAQRRKKFYSIRNRFIMMRKNDPAGRLFIFFLPLFIYELLRLSYLFLRGEGRVYLSASASALSLIRKK